MNELFRGEIDIDRFWSERVYGRSDKFFYRPLSRKFNSVFYFLICFLSPIVLFLYSFYSFIYSIFFVRYKNKNELLGKDIWIDVSLKSQSMRVELTNNDFFVIDIRKLDFICYLSFGERFISFLLSLKQIFRVSVDYYYERLNFLDLYNVSCFVKFVIFANKKTSSLSLTNHYDRWAYAVFEFYHKGVNLWQHGALDSNFILTKKIKNINNLYALSDTDIEIWNSYIDSPGVVIEKQVSKFCVNEATSLDFLVISHPAYKKADYKLLAMLVESTLNKYQIGYKPHPAHLYSVAYLQELSKIGVDIIDKDFFPRARLLLSRGSTLGFEYESIGFKVLWCKDESVEDLHKVIYEELND